MGFERWQRRYSAKFAFCSLSKIFFFFIIFIVLYQSTYYHSQHVSVRKEKVLEKQNKNSEFHRWSEPVEDPFDHAFDAVPESVAWIDEIDAKIEKKDQSLIFFITPTYKRPSQMVDMIRLSQSLMHDKGIYWIVVEDNTFCTKRIRHILHRSGLLFAHTSALTPLDIKGDPGKSRGVEQRNRALEIIERIGSTGVVYFGDDDNAYDIRLFDELRKTRRFSVFGVGFVGGGGYERCVVEEETGNFWYFVTNWVGGRRYSIDMAGFAFHTDLLYIKHPRFRNDWPKGFLETKFIEQILSETDPLEPLMDNCTRIFVWHVSTKGATMEPVQSDPLFHKYKTLL